MGPTLNRPFRDVPKYSFASFQREILGPSSGEHRCNGPTLAGRKQLCEPTLGSSAGHYGQNHTRKGLGNSSGSSLAQPALVSEAKNYTSRHPHISTARPEDAVLHGTKPRAAEELRVEGGNLESLWGTYLANLNWSERAISQYHLSLAKSTRDGYNRMIDKCEKFCLQNKIAFPPSDTRHLADLICYLSDGTPRPSSVLGSMMAALSHVYNALNLEDFTQNVHIRRLMTAVIKSGTQIPMCRSSVLPTDRFTDMFLLWEENP